MPSRKRRRRRGVRGDRRHHREPRRGPRHAREHRRVHRDETTAAALERVDGARQGKAVIILNPADPPMIMRNTVFCAVDPAADEHEIVRAVEDMAGVVASYVPGYRVTTGPLVEPGRGPGGTTKVSIVLEVLGAGDYLPECAGNLDIITAAAVATAEKLAPVLAGAVR